MKPRAVGSRDMLNADDDGRKRSLRGFASMDPERQGEVASMGGRATQRRSKAHQFTSEEAMAAGEQGPAAPLKSDTSDCPV